MYLEQTGTTNQNHGGFPRWFQMFTLNYERIPAGAIFSSHLRHECGPVWWQERHRLFLVQCINPTPAAGPVRHIPAVNICFCQHLRNQTGSPASRVSGLEPANASLAEPRIDVTPWGAEPRG